MRSAGAALHPVTIEDTVECGTGAYEKGEVRNLPVFKEAYEAGKSC